jgi:DNA polymerase-3 subunit beta
MKFSIDRAALLDPLQIVSNVVERRQTLPILANLLLVADGIPDGSGLTLTGSDQEVELGARTRLLQIEESGEITVPARKLLEICRSLPESAVLDFRMDGSRLGVESGRFKSHLATLPATDFPKVEMGDEEVGFSLPANALHDLLVKTSFAMAQQDVRYFFNGLLFETTPDMVRFVATNGQRLATSYLENLRTGEGKRQFIVPRKAVSELFRLIPNDADLDVEVRFSSNHLQVLCGDANLTTKLIDASYPDYSRAIPDRGDKVLVGDRQEIREALIRTAILSNEMYNNVRLKLESGKLEMHSNNPSQEEAEESVSVDYNGEALEIGFNVSYLIDALSVISGEKVEITFSDSNSACLLTSPDDINSIYVISPMVL